MLSTRHGVLIVGGEGGWKFSENLISREGLNRGVGFSQKFKNIGNGWCVVNNVYVEAMKTILF